MKKHIILVFNLLLLVILCGCYRSEYTVEMNGKKYEVNHNTNTIYDGKYTYEFDYTGDATSYEIDITYPNGTFYSEAYGDEDSGYVSTGYRNTGNEGEEIASVDDSNEDYESGSTLCYLITYNASKTSPVGKILLVIFLVALGIFFIVAPDKAWMSLEGYRYNNVEPSNTGLAMIVVSGVFFIILGIVVFACIFLIK
ncbi:MAG: hypothetical protein IJD40_08205 [Lachnospiraceae bacterium]|nr:hypothetical protein [Lachnospiraceae bacterium]